MWTFEIAAGKFYNPAGEFVSKVYAGGDCGKHPEGRNNPDMCSVHNIGPLPEGLYTRGEAVEHSQLGAFAIPLNPDPTNEMYGRRGFYFHGDTEIPGNASDGCIVGPRQVRNDFYASADRQIRVVGSL